ncbi:hypothetical protein ADK70_37860 [Streptomyces rimosus subsp. pseudoverticillatus]|nr:hypothetical protein ADK70_37860 [Streptomyces rimosus subsp. pseudoverticillatus]
MDLLSQGLCGVVITLWPATDRGAWKEVACAGQRPGFVVVRRRMEQRAVEVARRFGRISPARRSEDSPLPDGPAGTGKGLSRTLTISCWMRSSRPTR